MMRNVLNMSAQASRNNLRSQIASKEGRFTPAQLSDPFNVEPIGELSGGKPPFLTCMHFA